MGYENTNIKAPVTGGVQSINTPKGSLPPWVEEIAGVAGDIREVGAQVVEFVNENEKVNPREGGVKGAGGNEWDWWNPFTWAYWPWEKPSDDAGEQENAMNPWVKWGIVLLLGILAYKLIKEFVKGDKGSW